MSPLLNEPIGVLIVDDSPFMRMTIQKILSQDPQIKVLGTARDGLEGIEKIQTLHPQVVTMDVEMPVMDGLQALGEIMRWRPTPVIIFSSVTTQGAEATLKALDLGAFDVVAKPTGSAGADLKTLSIDLLAKVKGAANVNMVRLGKRNSSATYSAPFGGGIGAGSGGTTGVAATSNLQSSRPSSGAGEVRIGAAKSAVFPRHPVEIVAIGTSTGGPSALQTVLPQLPGNFPVPVLVAQHMPVGFTGPLASRLNGLCPLNVREGVHGEMLKAGTVYVAPAGKQIQVQRRGGQLMLNIGDETPIRTLYHPSVDVMFLSLAKEVGRGTLGVVMTGMGNDGAMGMKEIKKANGFAVAEAEETCVVYGMPRAIIDGGMADWVAPVGEIGRSIVECVMRR